jgi:hypothetical protein
MVGSIMLIYIWEFRSYGSGGELCCRNSPLSPPRCLARGSDPLGASSPWDLAPESLSPTGQGQGNAVGTRDECHGPADARSPAQCAWKQCGNLKYRLNPCPPAFPQHNSFLCHKAILDPLKHAEALATAKYVCPLVRATARMVSLNARRTILKPDCAIGFGSMKRSRITLKM